MKARVHVSLKNGVLDPTVVETAVHFAQARELNAQIYNRTKTQVDMQVYVTDAERRVLFDSAGIEKPGSISNRRDVVLTLVDIAPRFDNQGAKLTHIAEPTPDIHPNDAGYTAIVEALKKVYRPR